MLDSPKFWKKINSRGSHPELEVLYYKLLKRKKGRSNFAQKINEGVKLLTSMGKIKCGVNEEEERRN